MSACRDVSQSSVTTSYPCFRSAAATLPVPEKRSKALGMVLLGLGVDCVEDWGYGPEDGEIELCVSSGWLPCDDGDEVRGWDCWLLSADEFETLGRGVVPETIGCSIGWPLATCPLPLTPACLPGPWGTSRPGRLLHSPLPSPRSPFPRPCPFPLPFPLPLPSPLPLPLPSPP